jgi:galactonate dehydratase
MKITDIKTFATWVGHRNQTVVKVETDEGLYGLGEAGISSRDMAVVGAIQHYREWLIGRDPLRTGALWQEMYRSQYFEGGRVLLAAQSAIDIALYDIKGKALGVPVYELLGGAQHEAVPCFATLRLHDYGAVREGVQTLLDAGWNVIRGMIPLPFGDGEKVFEPRESLPQAAAILTRLRAEVGPGPVLGLDYHHRLNVAEAASFCQRLPRARWTFSKSPSATRARRPTPPCAA